MAIKRLGGPDKRNGIHVGSPYLRDQSIEGLTLAREDGFEFSAELVELMWHDSTRL